MYFHSLNIIRKQPEQSEIELIMIVFTDQEDVSDEKAEQYVELLYDGSYTVGSCGSSACFFTCWKK